MEGRHKVATHANEDTCTNHADNGATYARAEHDTDSPENNPPIGCGNVTHVIIAIYKRHGSDTWCDKKHLAAEQLVGCNKDWHALHMLYCQYCNEYGA